MPSLADIQAQAFQAEMAQLRKMTPEQLAKQSLVEQDIQRRSALLTQRPPIHYGGLPNGYSLPGQQPRGFTLDQPSLAAILRLLTNSAYAK